LKKLKNLILSPKQYQTTRIRDLLEAAARGHAGLDRRLLKAILDRGQEALPELLDFAMQDRESTPVDLDTDLLNLFRALGSSEALPFYLHCARHNQEEEISDQLAEIFASLGAASVEPLLALYEDLGEESGSEVAFWLASLRVRDRRITDLLLDRLDYDTGDGAFLLGIYGDPDALPALRERLEEVAAAGDPASRWVRHELESAIRQLEQPEPDAEVIEEPFDIWPLYPETALPRFDILNESELVAFLDSPEPEYRQAAIEELGLRTPQGRVRARLFELAQNDPEAQVRGSAWEALGGLEDAELIERRMRERLLDASAPAAERAGALVGLALGQEDEAVDRMMRQFYQEPSLRAKALEAMRRSLDGRYAEYFTPHIDDADPDIRRQAIWAVGNLMLSGEAARLRRYFDDLEFRADALYAYALAVPGETSYLRMPRLFRKIDELAGGLSPEEAYLVKTALNQRLESHGLDPVFFTDQGEEPEEWADSGPHEIKQPLPKAGRNDPCPCGSGKKFKKCCGA